MIKNIVHPPSNVKITEEENLQSDGPAEDCEEWDNVHGYRVEDPVVSEQGGLKRFFSDFFNLLFLSLHRCLLRLVNLSDWSIHCEFTLTSCWHEVRMIDAETSSALKLNKVKIKKMDNLINVLPGGDENIEGVGEEIGEDDHD